MWLTFRNAHWKQMSDLDTKLKRRDRLCDIYTHHYGVEEVLSRRRENRQRMLKRTSRCAGM